MNPLEQQLQDHISAAIRWGMAPERPAYQRALAELSEKPDHYDVEAFIALRGELEAEVLSLVPEWVKTVIASATQGDVQSALEESTEIVWIQLVAINQGIYRQEHSDWYLLQTLLRGFPPKTQEGRLYHLITDQDGWGHRIPWKERLAMQANQSG